MALFAASATLEAGLDDENTFEALELNECDLKRRFFLIIIKKKLVFFFGEIRLIQFCLKNG